MSLDIYLWVPKCDHCGRDATQVFTRNITHNVRQMWKEAGVHEALYKSDGWPAQDLIAPIEAAMKDMIERPDVYEALNPPNGWGSAKGAYNFLKELLYECRRYPNATVEVSA